MYIYISRDLEISRFKPAESQESTHVGVSLVHAESRRMAHATGEDSRIMRRLFDEKRVQYVFRLQYLTQERE